MVKSELEELATLELDSEREAPSWSLPESDKNRSSENSSSDSILSPPPLCDALPRGKPGGELDASGDSDGENVSGGRRSGEGSISVSSGPGTSVTPPPSISSFSVLVVGDIWVGLWVGMGPGLEEIRRCEEEIKQSLLLRGLPSTLRDDTIAMDTTLRHI